MFLQRFCSNNSGQWEKAQICLCFFGNKLMINGNDNHHRLNTPIKFVYSRRSIPLPLRGKMLYIHRLLPTLWPYGPEYPATTWREFLCHCQKNFVYQCKCCEATFPCSVRSKGSVAKMQRNRNVAPPGQRANAGRVAFSEVIFELELPWLIIATVPTDRAHAMQMLRINISLLR